MVCWPIDSGAILTWMSEGTETVEIRAPSGVPRWLARARADVPFFVLAAFIIVLDQVTKQVVRSNLALGESWPERDWVLRITHVTNSGAAFGILQGQTPFLIVTTFLGLAAILLYYFYPPMEHGFLRFILGLQLGGALGNLIDRVRLGEVTDFIDFRFWPAFNVADSSISIGVVGVLLFFVLYEGSGWRRRAPSA